MFEVEKPRRFHYEPRFYDPEKEKWEALKKKYAMQKEADEAKQKDAEQSENSETGEKDLEYFEQRVRSLNRQEHKLASRLTWRDFFRKREMPKFNYHPRFTETGMQQETPSDTDGALGEPVGEDIVKKYRQPIHQIKIRRRFDISDPDYMKPISGTKIILYCFIVFLLVTVIIAL